MQHVGKKVGEKLPVLRKVQQFNASEGESSRLKDNTSIDSDGFVDSDYVIEDGDDEILETFLDAAGDEPKLRDNKKAKGSSLKAFEVSRPDVVSDEEDTNEEGLELPDTDGEGECGHGLKSFRDADMQNPAFSVGLVFPSVE